MQKESNFNNSLTGTDQFTRALIDQTITHTTSIQQLEERVSKLPDPTAALTALEQRVQKLEDLQTKTIAAIDESTETLKIIADRLLLPATLINQLSRQLQQHGKLFERPLEKSVHYTHFVGRSVLVCTLLGLVILVLGFFYGRLRITANELEGNDIKWRHVKLSTNGTINKLLTETDTAYRADPDRLKAAVIAEEERRRELFDKTLQLQQTREEVDELEQQGKRR